MSLVELIVVVSIMAVLTGLISVSVAFMFSKDADYAASAIDDELTEVRMLSMSRSGGFVLILDNTNNALVINKMNGAVIDEEYKRVALKRGAAVAVTGPDGSPVDAVEVSFIDGTTSSGYKIEFDKGNGSVSKINGGGASSGVYRITATSTRLSSKSSTVNLVTTTGRHYIDK